MKIFSQREFINTLLLTALAALIGCGFLAYEQSKRLPKASAWVFHTYFIIGVMNQAHLSLTDAESRITYYLISNDKQIISNIKTLHENTKTNIKNLTQLTRDNKSQVDRLNKLIPLVNKKISYMNEMLNAEATEGKSKALQMAVNPEHKKAKEQIAALVEEINHEELSLLKQRYADYQQTTRLNNIILIIAGSVSLSLVFLSFILINYHLSRYNRMLIKQHETENELLHSYKNLKESEERFLLATEGSHAGLWDAIPGSNYVYFSPYFKKLLGYTDEEFPNTLASFENVLHPDDRDRVWDTVNAHLHHHIPYDIEYRLRLKSGEYHWFSASGQALWDKEGTPIRISGSLVDINERKKNEQRQAIQYAVTQVVANDFTIEESLVKLSRLISEQLQWEYCAVWMVNDETNSLLPIGYWQQPALDKFVFGKETRNTVFTKGVGLPGQVWAIAKPIWITSIQQDKNFPRLVQANEAGFHSAVCFPILVRSKVIGVIEILSCTTEKPDQKLINTLEIISGQIGQFIQRKWTEIERQKIDKIKNEFISVVSHELRTPITSIRGSLGLLLGGVVGTFSDKAKKLLDIANNNCERLLLLINDILDIEKIGAGKMVFQIKPCSIDHLVNEAIVTNKIYADKFNVSLELTHSLPGVNVQVDSHRLLQVLTNLISNAVKFSPAGSKISLSITKQDYQVRVAIADKGPGVSKEFATRIFQKFSQADSSDARVKGGTGLGLSISKAIIEKLGGTLNFYNQEGGGAVFYFDLPIVEGGDIKVHEKNEELSLAEKNNILICEDDEDQARYLATLLQSAGFKVDVAHSIGQARVQLLKNNYQILLLDLMLPDQSGIEFIKELKQHKVSDELRIIVLSSIAEAGKAIINGEAFPVVDWLEKPMDFNKVLSAIKRAN